VNVDEAVRRQALVPSPPDRPARVESGVGPVEHVAAAEIIGDRGRFRDRAGTSDPPIAEQQHQNRHQQRHASLVPPGCIAAARSNPMDITSRPGLRLRGEMSKCAHDPAASASRVLDVPPHEGNPAGPRKPSSADSIRSVTAARRIRSRSASNRVVLHRRDMETDRQARVRQRNQGGAAKIGQAWRMDP
jgi:hypothetical protein